MDWSSKLSDKTRVQYFLQMESIRKSLLSATKNILYFFEGQPKVFECKICFWSILEDQRQEQGMLQARKCELKVHK